MKKKNTIAFVLFAVLAAVFVLLKTEVIFPQKQAAPSEYELAEPIFTADKDSIVRMEVTNPSGSFTFVKDNGEWSVSDRPEVLLQQALVTTFSWDYVKLKPSGTIEEHPADLSVYGLDHPQAELRLTLSDGTTTLFRLGDCADGSSTYYFQVEGDETVYLISLIEAGNLLNPLSHYRQSQLFECTEQELTSLSFRNETAEFSFEQKDGVWKMKTPYERSVYSSVFSEMIVQPLLSLTIKEFFDDAKPEECGLEEAAQRIAAGKRTLLLGNRTDTGTVYAKWEDQQPVFGVSEEALAFLQTDPLEYMDRYVFLPEIETVERFEGTVGDRKIDLRIDRSGGKERYLDDGKETEESVWKEKFQQLLNAEIVGFADETPQTDEAVTYTATMTDGSRVEVSYRPYGERSYAVSLNGKTLFCVSKNTIDEMIGNFEGVD